jgi:erythromycin esterase-like protein
MADRAERLATATDLDVSRLVGRFGDRRVVLLGEATHGTSEFYAMRAEITKALIRQGDCRIVALEADWPDAARIDAYVRGRKDDGHEWRAFSRFPTWMWRNREFRAFVDWLHAHNAKLPEHDRVAVRGLDLYSLYTSADAVIRHLDRIDPQAAAVARQRYGCLSPWEQDPATYGLAASRGSYGDCEEDVVTMLEDLLRRGRTAWSPDGDRFLDMVQNARLVKNAERYYRAMYHGGREAWNVRDSHMYETLMVLLEDVGEDASAVVWAHNSHIGDARATEMARRGEHNIGQLCRQALQSASYLIGFGTHHGTVAAADHWGGEVKVKKVSPSRTDSYERLAHDTRVPVMLLPLHEDAELAEHLAQPRLERAIGVVYRPQTELSSHYFQAVLPEQFDEYAWVDETHAVTPLAAADVGGVPDTYPFGV